MVARKGWIGKELQRSFEGNLRDLFSSIMSDKGCFNETGGLRHHDASFGPPDARRVETLPEPASPIILFWARAAAAVYVSAAVVLTLVK